ncbi:hypothetical protein [Clostridium sp. 1001275B_160808_H3]|nr:hypothetical protein [Clostridium sp. 1001275B_160808_H3]
MYDIVMILPKDTTELEKKLGEALAKIANNRLNEQEKIELLKRLENK